MLNIHLFLFLGTRLRNISIELFFNDRLQFKDEKPVLCGRYPGTVGPTVTINCMKSARGRFLKINLHSNNILTLCEVEVFGEAAPKPGIYIIRPCKTSFFPSILSENHIFVYTVRICMGAIP